MAHDPVLVENTRAWLVRADTDIRSAVADLSAKPPILDDVLFHCQQAAEKSLKAFLFWRDVSFGKTHDLENLGVQCMRLEPDLAPLLDRAKRLTKYATMFRYPGAPYEPTAEEAHTGLALAREIFGAIQTRLPSETWPQHPGPRV